MILIDYQSLLSLGEREKKLERQEKEGSGFL